VAEVEESGMVRCERCGALKPASGCACGGQGRGRGEPTVPEGWDPELTRTPRPRLQIVGKPPPAPDRATDQATDQERPG